MTQLRKPGLAALLASAAAVGQAAAALGIAAVRGGAPTGVNLNNLDALTLGTGSPLGIALGLSLILTPNAAVAQGAVPGVQAAPASASASRRTSRGWACPAARSTPRTSCAAMTGRRWWAKSPAAA
jgi:hypothetical protein